jgi:hypothetical protein
MFPNITCSQNHFSKNYNKHIKCDYFLIIILTDSLQKRWLTEYHYDYIYNSRHFISTGYIFYGKFVESIFKPDV